jgi:predicted DNA-binding protein
MPSVRTQIYLTVEQRERLGELALTRNSSLAELVREAIEQYLARGLQDPDHALEATFGVLPMIEPPPRAEWDRG